MYYLDDLEDFWDEIWSFIYLKTGYFIFSNFQCSKFNVEPFRSYQISELKKLLSKYIILLFKIRLYYPRKSVFWHFYKDHFRDNHGTYNKFANNSLIFLEIKKT